MEEDGEMEKEENKDKDMEVDHSGKFKEQLLAIKTSLEKLQSDFGCTSNYLLIVEDNVTEQAKEKIDVLSTSGRILCCGDGEPKKFFSEGNMAFEPSVMSFLQKGDRLEEDKQFMDDWASAVKMGGQVKQEAGIENNLEMGNQDNQDMPDYNMVAMADMLAQAQNLASVKQEPIEAGENANVKSEPMDGGGDIDPSMFLAMAMAMNMNGQGSSGLPGSGMNPFMMQTKIDSELVKNAKVVHSEGGVNYSCSFCDFKTTCSKRLSVHVRSLHGTGLKKLVCKQCKFASMNKQEMSKHIMSKHKKALIRCKEDKCSFVTLSIEQFRAHAEEHKQNVPGVTLDFKCDFCNFRTSSRKGIGVHINRIHSTESPAMRMMQKKKNERHEAKKAGSAGSD